VGPTILGIKLAGGHRGGEAASSFLLRFAEEGPARGVLLLMERRRS
jgi:hypothetical protein